MYDTSSAGWSFDERLERKYWPMSLAPQKKDELISVEVTVEEPSTTLNTQIHIGVGDKRPNLKRVDATGQRLRLEDSGARLLEISRVNGGQGGT